MESPLPTPEENSDGNPRKELAAVPAAEARSLLRTAHRRLTENKPSEAVDLLLQASRCSPDDPAILESLAAAYRQNGQHLHALQTYDHLIDLGLATAETWSSTGNVLADVGEFAQAMDAYQNGLTLAPNNAEIHHNLGRVCYRLGQVDRAIQHLESAANEAETSNSWLSLATLIPCAPGASHQRVLDVRCEYARRLALETAAMQPRPIVARQQHEPLRIGYVSSFFHGFNYMKPVWGLINHHDRARFQISLFSDSPTAKGMPGYRVNPADRQYDTGALNTARLAELIRNSEIDILVDLNAYSTPERLPLFLHPCAPLTVAWFNMYATSGLPAFDYLVGDDQVIRRDEEPFYTEKVLRLPVSYLTFEVTHPVPPVAPPPSLRTGRITFGSLVSQYKITPPVLDAWAAILRRTPGSSLLIANAALKSRCNREYLLEQFSQRGVESVRLQLCGPAEHLDFLRYYDQIDIALDAFPYNGGTTTMEAIWQGVPVLTFDGDRWASRTSQSLLRQCHLAEFVAEDAAGMVEMAVSLAADPSSPTQLNELRSAMRARLAASPACDVAGLARGMEALYRQIWDRHTADASCTAE